ncbi:MAG: hypothetical protein ACT4PW_07155 [Acidimicrobiia bacterium]
MKLDRVTHLAKDVTYVSVGLGVLAFQKLQVQRQQLKRRRKASPTSGSRLSSNAASKRTRTASGKATSRLQSADATVQSLLDQVEGMLPGPCRVVAHQARSVADGARRQVGNLVRPNRG